MGWGALDCIFFFAIETSGGLGREAREFVKLLLNISCGNMNPSYFESMGLPENGVSILRNLRTYFMTLEDSHSLSNNIAISFLLLVYRKPPTTLPYDDLVGSDLASR
jgi:hypothetical protein